MYSRFASKADMFLALLEDRIAERAGQNAQLAELMLSIETGRALEQIANLDALGGPDLPVLHRRRAVRRQEVEPDPVHPHDQHVSG